MPMRGAQVQKSLSKWMSRSIGTWVVFLSFLILLGAPWLFEKMATNAFQTRLERSALTTAQKFSSVLETAEAHYSRSATTTANALENFDTITNRWISESDSMVAVKLVDSSGLTVMKSHSPSAIWGPVSRIALAHAFELQAPSYSATFKIQERFFIDLIVPVKAPNPLAFVLTFDTALLSRKLFIEENQELVIEVVPFTEKKLDDVLNSHIVNLPSWEGLWSLKFQSKDPLVILLTALRPIFIILILLITLLFYGHWRNFQRQEKIEKETAERSKFLEKQNKLSMLGEMSASLAHEINQPLSTIANYAAAGQMHLMQKDPNSVLLPFFQKIQTQTERAGKVLTAVRAMIHPTPMDGSVLDISALIDELEPHLRLMCAEHEVILRIQNKRDTWVYLNSILFKQVLINLVKNSIQALEATQHSHKVIWLDVKTEKKHLLIEVRDNGPGIPRANEAAIFDSFFTTKTDGLGIGLNLCRSVVERFNGQLFLKSNGADGACFLIDLPLVGSPAPN